MTQLQFQLDFLDEIVGTLRRMAGEHEEMSRGLHHHAGAAQSIGADGWVVDQVRYAASLLGGHPDLFFQLASELDHRLQIAHQVADEWNGATNGLRVALTGAMTSTTGLLAHTKASTKSNQAGQKTDRKSPVTKGVLGASSAMRLMPSSSRLVMTTGGYDGNVVGSLGETHVYRDGQCVDLVKRFFEDQWKVSGWQFLDEAGRPDGSAFRMFAGHPSGTTASLNGGPAAPRAGDVIVFTDGGYGHVAIITKVNGDSVTFVQQNVAWNDGVHFVLSDTVPLTHTQSGGKDVFQIGTPDKSVPGEGGHVKYGTCLGWVHANSNTSSATPALQMGPTVAVDGDEPAPTAPTPKVSAPPFDLGEAPIAGQSATLGRK